MPPLAGAVPKAEAYHAERSEASRFFAFRAKSEILRSLRFATKKPAVILSRRSGEESRVCQAEILHFVQDDQWRGGRLLAERVARRALDNSGWHFPDSPTRLVALAGGG
jgi:ABC-type phosphate transport system auxiliary subunit